MTTTRVAVRENSGRGTGSSTCARAHEHFATARMGNYYSSTENSSVAAVVTLAHVFMTDSAAARM